MGISEKTVELNVTRTVIEKMRRFHRRPAYSIGATQTQEAQFGFDVDITDGSWSGGIIQYKRLYKQASSGAYRWNLNETKKRDQHSLLLWLEGLGLPVLYCFPKFDDEGPLRAWSPPSLWKQVWWVRPQDIAVPAPVDARHHVELSTAGVWAVFSEKGQTLKDPTVSFEESFLRPLAKRQSKGSVKHLKEALNTAIEERSRTMGGPESSRAARYAASTLAGMQLIALGPDTRATKSRG